MFTLLPGFFQAIANDVQHLGTPGQDFLQMEHAESVAQNIAIAHVTVVFQYILQHFEPFFQLPNIAKHTFSCCRVGCKQAADSRFKDRGFQLTRFGKLFYSFTGLKQTGESNDMVVPGFIQCVFLCAIVYRLMGASTGIINVCAFDYCAAEANLALIKHHRLTGCNRALGKFKFDEECFSSAFEKRAGLVLLAIADFGV